MNAVREATLDRLRALGLSEAPPLPLLEDGLALRSAEEVAHRANVLHILYAMALSGPESAHTYARLLQRQGWDRFLTPREQSILNPARLLGQDLIDLSWRKESCRALLWAGSIEDGLLDTFEECDFSHYYPLIPPERPLESFLAAFQLREPRVILECLDLHYCLHWFCRRTERMPEEVAASVQPSVIIERRRALEWLTHDLPWDEIAMDT